LRKGATVKIVRGTWQNETGVVLEICARYGVLTLRISGLDRVERVPMRACTWSSM